MYAEIYWWDVPEVKNAYDNGKDFTGVDLTNVCFIHEKTTKEIVLLDLTGANFKGCDLSSVTFCGADVRGVDFTGANLEGCEFYACYFGDRTRLGIYLETVPDIRNDVIFEGALDSCCVPYAKPLYTVNNIRMLVDTDGQELICYKALRKHHFMRNDTLAIAKLLVPSDARRIVYRNDKCRAEKVKVLDIYSPDKKFYYKTAHSFVMGGNTLYKVGEEICADSFDITTCITCAHGIHFFLTEAEAIRFGKKNMRK